MTVTSTRRRSVSFSQVCHQQKFSPLEKIPLERAERELEGEECRAFILPFCLCIPVLPSFPLAPLSALLHSFLPPHQRMETLMRFGSRWLPATTPLFLLNDGAVVDILLTQRHQTRRRSLPEPSGGRREKKANNTSAPPYLGKTLSCVGLGDIHLNASVAAASSIASSHWRFEVADQWQTVMLQPCCEGVTLPGMPLFVFLLSD